MNKSTAETGLEGIPYLGAARQALLAEAGYQTREDLRRADTQQIGSVKGIGLAVATRVKDWLAAERQTPSPPVDSPDPILAEANQNVQDVFGKLSSAAARLKEHFPAKAQGKSLDRQLSKLDTVASELAEGPDTLTARQVEAAVKTLDKIAALLEAAAGAQKLSPKKQEALIDALRARRKRLEKTLGE